MAERSVRAAERGDLPRLTEIYNHYVVTSAITFDTEVYTAEARLGWFEAHSAGGRFQLVVAEEAGRVLAYAGTGPFRPKGAYETTVETTVYCAPEAIGRGLGTLLYAALFERLEGEDVHRAVAGVTLPNPASLALHRRFGFVPVGIFTENGRKLGRYWDVAWLEKPLSARATA